jgi:hypothetical protein
MAEGSISPITGERGPTLKGFNGPGPEPEQLIEELLNTETGTGGGARPLPDPKLIDSGSGVMNKIEATIAQGMVDNLSQWQIDMIGGAIEWADYKLYGGPKGGTGGGRSTRPTLTRHEFYRYNRRGQQVNFQGIPLSEVNMITRDPSGIYSIGGHPVLGPSVDTPFGSSHELLRSLMHNQPNMNNPYRNINPLWNKHGLPKDLSGLTKPLTR